MSTLKVQLCLQKMKQKYFKLIAAPTTYNSNEFPIWNHNPATRTIENKYEYMNIACPQASQESAVLQGI